MCWHFGICLEARNQQSITFRLALYFCFLLLLLCNNGLRTQQREALDLPAPLLLDMTPTAAFCPEHSHLIRAMLWGWGCFGMLLLWRAGSVSAAQPPGQPCLLILCSPAYLRAKDPQNICVFSGLSCYSAALSLTETCLWLCLFYSSLHSAGTMLLSWMQTCLVMRHLVICWPHVTVAFTNHRHTHLLFLQTEPVFRYLSAARIPFVSCFFVFCSVVLGQMNISLSAANWVWFFEGKETCWCIYTCWSRTEYFILLCISPPYLSSSFLSFLFLFWLMAKSQIMKWAICSLRVSVWNAEKQLSQKVCDTNLFFHIVFPQNAWNEPQIHFQNVRCYPRVILHSIL